MSSPWMSATASLIRALPQIPRIIEMSGVNIRDVFADDLPFRPQMIVSDVSFISLTYVIPVIARIAAPGAAVVLLVKPQFEVGRDGLGKNGIVESEELRRKALHDVMDCARREGLNVVATAPIADRRHCMATPNGCCMPVPRRRDASCQGRVRP